MKLREGVMLTTNLLLLVLLFPIVQVIFKQLGIVLFGVEVFSSQPWLHTIFSHLIILFLLFFYLKATLEPLKNWGFVYSKQYLWLSVGIGVVASIVLYLIDIAQGFFEIYSVPADPTFFVALGFVLAWGVIGPLTEEILFRGIIQTTLRKKIGVGWVAIAGTVFLEVFMHAGILSGGFSGWAMLSYVFVFSLAASLVYARTRSLVGPLLIHAIGNVGELLIYWIV
jgi:membrane protease YdiL (CAAX protease family)